MPKVEFTVESGIFTEKQISPVPGRRPSLKKLDRLFERKWKRKINIEEKDIIGMGEKRTPSILTKNGFNKLTKGHPGYPKHLHGRIAEYCVMHALHTLHGLIKPGHHPNTGGKTPDFVYPYYLGSPSGGSYIEVVTECKSTGKKEGRKSRCELRDALVKQIDAYAMPPGSMRCVHCVNLQDKVIRNYWIDKIPPFLTTPSGSSLRSSTPLTGEQALDYIRIEELRHPLFTYFLAKWLGKEPNKEEKQKFENRKEAEMGFEGKKIYEALTKIDYDCSGIIEENGLVVGPTPDGDWHRLDEYRMIKFRPEP